MIGDDCKNKEHRLCVYQKKFEAGILLKIFLNIQDNLSPAVLTKLLLIERMYIKYFADRHFKKASLKIVNL